mgnify:CR=1 FL=1
MKRSDRDLGMDRTTSRRDVLLGVGASVASSFVPGHAFADEMFRPGASPGACVAFAESDARSCSLVNIAIDQAHRAVNELA